MKPYILTSPDLVEENTVSGGVRVMWGLFGWLLAKGQLAYMNRWGKGENIAVYPEIQQGNPTGASTVVRYILNKPGIMGAIYDDGHAEAGPTEFDKNDKIYVFSKIYDQWGVDDNHILFLPIANLSVFKDQGRKRTKTCYLVGKGKNLGVHPNGSIELTRAFATDQQALANLLNECEVMYCYDKLSAMMELARLCGCRVQYLGSYSKHELELYEPTLNGVSLPYEPAKLDVKEFRNHYISLIKQFEKKLETFIEETQ